MLNKAETFGGLLNFLMHHEWWCFSESLRWCCHVLICLTPMFRMLKTGLSHILRHLHASLHKVATKSPELYVSTYIYTMVYVAKRFMGEYSMIRPIHLKFVLMSVCLFVCRFMSLSVYVFDFWKFLELRKSLLWQLLCLGLHLFIMLCLCITNVSHVHNRPVTHTSTYACITSQSSNQKSKATRINIHIHTGICSKTLYGWIQHDTTNSPQICPNVSVFVCFSFMTLSVCVLGVWQFLELRRSFLWQLLCLGVHLFILLCLCIFPVFRHTHMYTRICESQLLHPAWHDWHILEEHMINTSSFGLLLSMYRKKHVHHVELVAVRHQFAFTPWTGSSSTKRAIFHRNCLKTSIGVRYL